MKNLIIPMAGKSSRFPDMRPKWMLTHPMTNRFMGIESILGFNLEFFDNIYYKRLWNIQTVAGCFIMTSDSMVRCPLLMVQVH